MRTSKIEVTRTQVNLVRYGILTYRILLFAILAAISGFTWADEAALLRQMKECLARNPMPPLGTVDAEATMRNASCIPGSRPSASSFYTQTQNSNIQPPPPPTRNYPSSQNFSSTQTRPQPNKEEPIECLEVVKDKWGRDNYHNRCNFAVQVSYCTAQGACQCRDNPISGVCGESFGPGSSHLILGSGHVYSAQCKGTIGSILPILENGKQYCR